MKNGPAKIHIYILLLLITDGLSRFLKVLTDKLLGYNCFRCPLGHTIGNKALFFLNGWMIKKASFAFRIY